MSGEEQASVRLLIGCLVLVASALLVRDSIAQGLKMFAGWALIFLAVFADFILKATIPRAREQVDGGRPREGRMAPAAEMTDPAIAGWRFLGRCRAERPESALPGRQRRHRPPLSTTTARRAGIEPIGGFPVMVNTANGNVQASRGRADRLRVGTIERLDLPVHIAEEFGPTDVLGMNFLSSLSSWGVEGQWLVLKP